MASTTESMSGASSSARPGRQRASSARAAGRRARRRRRSCAACPGSTRSSSNQRQVVRVADEHRRARGRAQDAGRRSPRADQRVHERRLAGAGRAADDHQQRRLHLLQPRHQVVVDLGDELVARAARLVGPGRLERAARARRAPSPGGEGVRQGARGDGRKRPKKTEKGTLISTARRPDTTRAPVRSDQRPSAGAPSRRAARSRERAAPAGHLEHRPDQDAVHVAQKGVGLDAKLEQVSRATRSKDAREDDAAGSAGGRWPVGVKAVKSRSPARGGGAGGRALRRRRGAATTARGGARRARGPGGGCGPDRGRRAPLASRRAEKPSGRGLGTRGTLDVGPGAWR